MLFLICGLAGLAFAFWGLARDVGFIAQPFYAYAWWSYILTLDGFVLLRRGSSILTARRALFLPLVTWSVTFWFSFELLNLKYQNWYYVGVFAADSTADLVAGPLFGILSFATVFLGLFETYEAITALRSGPAPPSRPRVLPRRIDFVLQGFGVLTIALSLLCSRYLAPLVWGSVTFLLDPWNHRRGARSLLGELEARGGGTIVRLLLSGAICGLVWESFNYLAPQKWIYTVRGLEELKLFEMPLLGFLGFPALALDAFAFFAFVSFWFHGNRTWENPEDVHQELAPRRPTTTRRFAATLPFHVVFWFTVAFSMQWVNVGSVELSLEDLDRLPPGATSRLRAEGIERPRRLLSTLSQPERRAEIARSLDLSPHEMELLEEELRLFLFKGIGGDHGTLLHRAGIFRIEELARADPDSLYETLVRLRGNARFPALRREMVRVWVFAARAEG
jgi:hypothetical protein